jgi:OOP family OmpA-OmpF porin
MFGQYRWRTAWGEEPGAWQQKSSYTDRIGMVGLRYSFGDRSLPDPAAIEQQRYESPPPPPPESDLDGDGVADLQDDCPGTRPGIMVNSSGCPADSDLDGVTDDIDECPRSVAGVRIDSRGCEIREVIELRGVYFENDSDVLIPGAERVLAQAAATLLANPDLEVEIGGHTDDTGDAGRNIHLSLRRAFAVRAFLIEAGVNPDNLTARGYGESSPVASNTTEAGRAENRRVELRVLNQ